MSDQQDEFEEASDPELLDDETETEWVGEEEWGDEEEENVALVEEEVPSFIDNGDGTISDTQANLMWKKDDSFKKIVHKKGHADWNLDPSDCKKHNLCNNIRVPDWKQEVKVKEIITYLFERSRFMNDHKGKSTYRSNSGKSAPGSSTKLKQKVRS